MAESSGVGVLGIGVGAETGLGGESIEQVPAAVGLCRRPCVGSRGTDRAGRKGGPRAAEGTSGPVGVEAR